MFLARLEQSLTPMLLTESTLVQLWKKYQNLPVIHSGSKYKKCFIWGECIICLPSKAINQCFMKKFPNIYLYFLKLSFKTTCKQETYYTYIAQFFLIFSILWDVGLPSLQFLKPSPYLYGKWDKSDINIGSRLENIISKVHATILE